MRFDDTNPAKESAEFEAVSVFYPCTLVDDVCSTPVKGRCSSYHPVLAVGFVPHLCWGSAQVITKDLGLLGIEWDIHTHTSDHFETLVGYPRATSLFQTDLEPLFPALTCWPGCSSSSLCNSSSKETLLSTVLLRKSLRNSARNCASRRAATNRTLPSRPVYHALSQLVTSYQGRHQPPDVASDGRRHACRPQVCGPC